MKKKILIICLLLIYLFGFTFSYKYFSIAFSRDGRWESLSPDLGAVILTLIPGFNLPFAFDYFTGSMYKNEPEHTLLKTIYNIED